MRWIAMPGMAAGIVLLGALILAMQSTGQLAFALPSYSPLTVKSDIPFSLGENNVITPTNYAYLPLINRLPGHMPWVDPGDRQTSLDYFNQVYRASEGIPINWTGSHADCVSGETSPAFRGAVQMRINYFRAMAGLPGTIQLSEEHNRKAQQAALMMSVNGQLSHSPPPSWLCYTAEGAEAADSSNLFLGVYGPTAITGYMEDPGSGNYFVGHRRWILYPQTLQMGTGDIPNSGSHWSSNALWVFDENMSNPRPQTREKYVAWPPPGYVPYQVVFQRWSFAYAGADFSGAAVTMGSGGQNITVALQPVVNGYGENTLVWVPDLSLGSPPPGDTAYDVTVAGVKISGVPQDFAYQVILFDPGSLARMPVKTPLRQLYEAPVPAAGR
jgi:uncharacterized protein YkwD